MSINLKRETGNKFTVKFICTEWDKDILGRTYADSRMDHKAVAFTHNFNSSGSWNDISGTRKLDTNPGSDCSTELTYTIAIH